MKKKLKHFLIIGSVSVMAALGIVNDTTVVCACENNLCISDGYISECQTDLEENGNELLSESDVIGGLIYTKKEDGIYVTGYTEEMPSEVAIPESIGGIRVVGISEGAFSDAANLTDITLPDSITVIGNAAFSRCSQLANVNLPGISDDLQIEGAIFSDCPSLQAVVIPSGWTKIPDRLFRYSSIKNIDVGTAAITEIGAQAFEYDNAIERIDLPATVTKIGAAAFGYATKLEEVVLPDNLIDIGQHAFVGCTALNSLSLPDTSEDISLYTGGILYKCTSLKSITIPAKWKKIPDYAFMNSSIENIDFGKSKVEEIGSMAFAAMAAPCRIVFPDTLKTVDKTAFYNLKNACLDFSRTDLDTISADCFGMCDMTTKLRCRYGSKEYYEGLKAWIDVETVDKEIPCYLIDDSYYTWEAMQDSSQVRCSLYYCLKDTDDQVAPKRITFVFNEDPGLVDGSLRLDGEYCEAEFKRDAQILCIPVTKPSGLVDFVIRPDDREKFNSYATADLQVNDNDTVERVLNKTVQKRKLAVHTIGITSSEKIIVRGEGEPGDTVRLYLDGRLMDTVQINKVGTFQKEITLYPDSEEQTFVIRAESGEDRAEAVVRYEKKQVELTQWKLYSKIHNRIDDYDMLDDSTGNYVPVPPKDPLIYVMKFSDPSAVCDVRVSSADPGEKKSIKAVYNSDIGAYVASGRFNPTDPDDVPTKVRVEYHYANTPDVETVEAIAQRNVLEDYDIQTLENTVRGTEYTTRIRITDKKTGGSFDVSRLVKSYKGEEREAARKQYHAENLKPGEMISGQNSIDEMWKNSDNKFAYAYKAGADELVDTSVDISIDYATPDLVNTFVNLALGRYSADEGSFYDEVGAGDTFFAIKATLGLIPGPAAPLLDNLVDIMGEWLKRALNEMTEISEWFCDSIKKQFKDPSGYVYEGAVDNYLSGATATLYYKDTDGTVTKWDAAEYGQVNPEITDAIGFYKWDVPDGLWQVRVEKSGYETGYSDWLPVPPPQLDVNIGMRALASPAILNVDMYSDSARIEFSQYMKKETLSAIGLQTPDGTDIVYTMECPDESKDADGNPLTKSCILKFDVSSIIQGDSLRLIIPDNTLKNYADKPLPSFSEVFICTKRSVLYLPSAVKMCMGDEKEISFGITDYDGQDIEAVSTFSDALEVVNCSLGDDGKGTLLVKKHLPIDADVTVTIKGTGLSAMCRVINGDSDENDDVVLWEDIPESGIIPDDIWIAGVEEKEYTGSKIIQSFRVYDGTKRLKEKVDYTVSYKNNINMYTFSEGDQGFDPKKAPSVIITGKGNYDSKEVAYFKILPQDIEGVDFSADDITLPATGKAQKIKPELYWNGKTLKNKTDYTFAVYKESDKSFATNMGDSITEEGNYVVRLTGNGNFTGTRDICLTLTSDYKLVKTLKVGKIPAQSYTGSAITPKPKIWDGNTVLTEGEEYTLSYASNVNVGTGYVIIKGVPEKGYAGSRRIGFKITAPKSSKAGAYDISEAKDTDHRITITCDTSTVFMKGGAKPAVVVKYQGADGSVRTLAKGRDYKLSYRNNTTYGGSKSPTVVVSGTGNFKGKREVAFAITEKNLNTVTLLADDVPYKNKANSFATKLTLTDTDGKALKANKDYDKDPVYVYVNSTEVTSNGSTVTRAAGDPVDKTDIIPVNTVIKVTVNAKAGSGYTGSASGEYKITTGSIASAKGVIPVQTYTGKPIELNKSDITVSVKGTPLSESDYDIVSYIDNTQKGTAKVTIRGKGNYGGLKTQAFKIKAKGFKWWWRK